MKEKIQYVLVGAVVVALGIPLGIYFLTKKSNKRTSPSPPPLENTEKTKTIQTQTREKGKMVKERTVIKKTADDPKKDMVETKLPGGGGVKTKARTFYKSTAAIGGTAIAVFTVPHCIKKDFDAHIDGEVGKLKLNDYRSKADIDAEKYSKMRTADAELHKQKVQANIEAAKARAEMEKTDKPSIMEAPVHKSIEDIQSGKDALGYDAKQLGGKLIYRGDRVILYSPPGCGKSTLATQIAIEISEGMKTLLFPNDQGENKCHKILYYDGERDEDDIRRNLGQRDICFEFLQDFFFESIEQWLNDVRKQLETLNGNVLVVLDNITCVCSTINAEIMRKLFLHDLKSLQNEYKEQTGGTLTFIVIAHTNKQLDLAGSSNLKNFATTVIGLVRLGDDHVALMIDKNRKYGELQQKSFALMRKTSEEGWRHFEYGNPLKYAPQTAAETVEKVEPEHTQNPQEQARAERKRKYEEVSILVGTKPWAEIQIQTGVSKQCFQNWKKEFGEPQDQ